VRMGDDPETGPVPVALVDSMWQRLNKVFCQTSSVQYQKGFEPVTLYPNPASDELILEMPEGKYSMAIKDLQGRILLQRTGLSGKTRLNIEILPAGTHLWSLINEDGQIRSGKLVVLP